MVVVLMVFVVVVTDVSSSSIIGNCNDDVVGLSLCINNELISSILFVVIS
jgi:cobalamin synthase